MSFQKFTTAIFSVGGTHRSATTNTVGDLTFNEKTGNEIKFLISRCLKCDRKKTMTVSDNTIAAKGLGDIVKSLGNGGLNETKKIAKKVLKIQEKLRRLHETLLLQLQLETLKRIISTTRGDYSPSYEWRFMLGKLCIIYVI